MLTTVVCSLSLLTAMYGELVRRRPENVDDVRPFILTSFLWIAGLGASAKWFDTVLIVVAWSVSVWSSRHARRRVLYTGTAKATEEGEYCEADGEDEGIDDAIDHLDLDDEETNAELHGSEQT